MHLATATEQYPHSYAQTKPSYEQPKWTQYPTQTTNPTAPLQLTAQDYPLTHTLNNAIGNPTKQIEQIMVRRVVTYQVVVPDKQPK